MKLPGNLVQIIQYTGKDSVTASQLDYCFSKSPGWARKNLKKLVELGIFSQTDNYYYFLAPGVKVVDQSSIRIHGATIHATKDLSSEFKRIREILKPAPLTVLISKVGKGNILSN